MYKTPKVTLGRVSSSTPFSVVLLEDKGKLDSKILKKFPKHLHKHPALQGKRGALLVGHGGPSKSFAVYGIGELAHFSPQEAYELGEVLGQRLASEQFTEVSVMGPSEKVQKHLSGFEGQGLSACAAGVLKGLSLSSIKIQEFVKEPVAKCGISRISVDPSWGLTKADISRLADLVQAIVFTRALVDLPPDVCDPDGMLGRFMAARKAMGLEKSLEVEVWDKKRLEKEGMGLLLGVGKGSPTPPKFVIIRYGFTADRKDKKALALVGKGLTFDTGGLHLKVHDWKSLLEMNTDMAGAGAVLGAMLCIAKQKLDSKVMGLVPMTSNSIGPDAVYPGAVLKAYDGQTVELQNTDAEGRMILADALCYAVKQGAGAIVDAATLTGGCQRALGDIHSGLMSNDAALVKTVRHLSEQSGEPGWILPLTRRYGDVLASSKIADMGNCGFGVTGSAQVGGKFLEKFVNKTPWVHVDIAGTCLLPSEVAGKSAFKASGVMVQTFFELARNWTG